MRDKVKQSISRVSESSKQTAAKFGYEVKKIGTCTTELISQKTSRIKDSMPSLLAFLSVEHLLKWTEWIMTKALGSIPTIYDKALDSKYLATHIGGGNHRMFDGGHDLLGAWTAVKNATPDDTFSQEVVGYVGALLKDVSTIKGLPFFTWSKDSYDKCAEWVSQHIPGATRGWFYDLMSFDILEIISTTIGVVSLIFLFKKKDRERFAEILGSMSIVSITSANPLAGIAVILATGYVYFIKKEQIDVKGLSVGTGLAGVSALIFAVLGLHVLIELGIVIVLTTLLRKRVIDNEELWSFLKANFSKVRIPKDLKLTREIFLKPGQFAESTFSGIK